MELVFERRVLARLRDMPPAHRAALMGKLKEIAADPFAPHGSARALRGYIDTFRVRQGDWRAIYEIDRNADVVRVVAVEPRGSVYQ